jgi:microsomal dipeptidase-like Zn-dependent dipeptidase
MPEGMTDGSKPPKITEALMRRGCTGEDNPKILGGDTARVMESAEPVPIEDAGGALTSAES